MLSPFEVIIEGQRTFGILFFSLFGLGVVIISLILYSLLYRVMGGCISAARKHALQSDKKDFAKLAVEIGSLQTLLSLSAVGFMLLSGALSANTKTFALLVQGFTSTAIGVTILIIVRCWNIIDKLFLEKYFKK